jgi:hypothetical protein
MKKASIILLAIILSLPALAGDILKCEPSINNDLDEAGVELIVDFALPQVVIFSIAGAFGGECVKLEQDMMRCTLEDSPIAGTAVLRYDRSNTTLSISNGIGDFVCLD